MVQKYHNRDRPFCACHPESMLSSRQMLYASAKVRNIFETKEDFEKKDKIIVLIGQVLREFA
jgi:hypothetical protein